MYERNGQPLEKVVRQFVRLYFLRPKKRPYKTNNFYAALARQDQLDREVYRIVQGKKAAARQGRAGKGRRRLTRAERREIDAAIRRAARTDKKELSAQDSIPYQRIWPDGVCRVTDTYYTKTVQFQDINYQLSQNEDKNAIFEGWCDFLNYFDSSVKFQLSFMNMAANKETYGRALSSPRREMTLIISAKSTRICSAVSLPVAQRILSRPSI